MFIYNLKINGRKTFKITFIVILITIFLIVGIVTFKIFNGASKSDYSILKNSVSEINTTNYTNILKAVSNNIDEYIGTKFTFTGYVYRLYDFKDNQFVLARNMITSRDSRQSVVVGFLCEYVKAKEFENDEWVTITGEIQKGYYQENNIPVVRIIDMKKAEVPKEEYVYPPSDTYIPTSGVI